MPETIQPVADPTAASIAAAVVAGATPAASTAPVTETPAAPATEAAEPAVRDPRMTERFAQLAQQTKKLAAEKQALAAERAQKEAALKAREDAIAARAAKAEELEKRLAAAKADPDAFLASLYGENYYDLLTEMRLTGKKNVPDLAVQALKEETHAEIARLRKENEDRFAQAEADKKAQTEAAKKAAAEQEKAVLDQWRTETVEHVKANPEKYELINLNEMFGEVPAVIEAMFTRTGRIMTAAEAADLVEAELVKRVERNVSSKTWTERQKAAAAAAKPAEETAPKTLTNAMGGTSQVSTSGYKPGSDRIARAVAAMEEAEAAAKARAAQG